MTRNQFTQFSQVSQTIELVQILANLLNDETAALRQQITKLEGDLAAAKDIIVQAGEVVKAKDERIAELERAIRLQSSTEETATSTDGKLNAFVYEHSENLQNLQKILTDGGYRVTFLGDGHGISIYGDNHYWQAFSKERHLEAMTKAILHMRSFNALTVQELPAIEPLDEMGDGGFVWNMAYAPVADTPKTEAIEELFNVRIDWQGRGWSSGTYRVLGMVYSIGNKFLEQGYYRVTDGLFTYTVPMTKCLVV